MDKAVAELRHTIEQAEEYQDSAQHHLEELTCHITALKEDTEIVESLLTRERKEEVDEVLREARRLRRDLEKLSFPLHRNKEARREQLQREDIEFQRLALLRLEKAQQQPSTPAPTQNKVSSAKLPNLKLPVFTGEIEQFRGFKQVFDDLFKEDPSMSSTKKWLLLKEHLGGKALELVAELPTSPETYQVAMDLLEEAYGSVNKAVAHLYQRLLATSVSTMNSETLRLTYARLDGILRALELLEEDVKTSRFLRTVVISKFPKALYSILRVTDDMDLPKFRTELKEYLRSSDNSLDSITLSSVGATTSQNGSAKEQPKSNRFKKPAFDRSQPFVDGDKKECSSSTTANSSCTAEQPPAKKFAAARPKKCAFCEGAHYSDQCDAYPTLEKRNSKLGNRCPKCFRTPHPGKDCAKTIKCAHCDECTHNRALCPKKFASIEKVCHIKDVSNTRKEVYHDTRVIKEVTGAEYVTLMLQVAQTPTSETQLVRGIVDTASRRVLIKRSLVQQLQLEENKKNRVKILGVSDVPVHGGTHPTCRLYLRPPNHKPVEIEAIIVDKIVDSVKAASVEDFRQKHPQYEQFTIPDEGNGREVELLIGTRALIPILTPQNSIVVSSTVQLLSTKFGWIVIGANEENEEVQDQSVAALVIQALDPVKLMCDLDTIGLKPIENTKNEEEAEALKKFYETLVFLDDMRYEVGIPFRYDPLDLTDNFGLAWGRLQSLWKKLSASPELLKAYNDQIRAQELSEIVEKVFEKNSPDQKVHYIAHQAVVRTEKSTPVRFVVDASAHAAGKRSLNDNILKGANWVDDMPSLILRFRKEEIAVTADVEKAFLQLSIRQQDRNLCRFLWLKDITKPPTKENVQVYRFRRVAFGIASSPFLLYATIKHHLAQHPHEFTGILERDIYADNLVTSVPKATNLLEFYRKVKETFSTMSMNMTKWTSNSKEFLQKIPEEHRLPQVEQTVLGLTWDTEEDTMGLCIKPAVFASAIKPTKRRILKEAASVFDPLGWIMPVILQARIFIRQVWKLSYTWDQPLDENLANEWQKIRQTLIRTAELKLPRQMFTSNDDPAKWEMHIFSDASIEAYAVVIFIKSQNQVAFVAAKSRLTPKRKLSIPRLELIAAVIASRYGNYVQQGLKIEKFHKVILWSDSKCILSWIKSNKILPAFVQKSIAEIKASKIDKFHYVPSEANPADVASRGSSFEHLQQEDWWKGPKWLPYENLWPKQDIQIEETESQTIAEELNTEETTLLTKINVEATKFDPMKIEKAPFNLDPNEFSSLGQLLKRSWYILRGINQVFLTRIKKTPFPATDEKTDYTTVQKIWLRWDQKRAYTEIPSNKKPNVSFLRNMQILEDEDRLLRCCTRLQNLSGIEETKYPFLLVKNSPLTKLIVMSTHVKNMHAGTAHTLAAIRRRYWLPNGRQQVFKIITDNCSICKRYTAKPFANPDMAPLPTFRVEPTETPFRNVGLDIFGPIKVQGPIGEPLPKRWVIIFTCLVVRAIHLEMIEDMTTVEMFHAFRRFFARRGTPEFFVSDNAPQFHVFERKLVSIWHHVSKAREIVNYFARNEVNWKFIPAHTPWMGGVYERLIKSVKASFEKTYAETIMTDKTLVTILTEVEAIVNSRPISYVDKSIETTIITPNNFLAVKYPAVPVNTENVTATDSIATLWKAAEQFLNSYWKKWSQYYILALRERKDDMKNKHLSENRQPKPGEIVIMAEPTSKRCSWNKAVIERLITSDDGKCRSAQIRIGDRDRTRMIRPITNLLSLDLFTDPPTNGMTLNKQMTALVHPPRESVGIESPPRRVRVVEIQQPAEQTNAPAVTAPPTEEAVLEEKRPKKRSLAKFLS